MSLPRSTLIEHTAEILTAIADAYEKIPPERLVIAGAPENESDIRESELDDLSYELAEDELEYERDDALIALHTPEQEELYSKILRCQKNPEMYDEGAWRALEDELQRSYEENPRQKEILDEYARKMAELNDRLGGDEFIPEGTLHACLKYRLPDRISEFAPERVYAMLLQRASAMMDGENSFTFENTMEQPVDALQVFAHRKGVSPRLMLPYLDKINEELKDPSVWKPIKTTQGVGYAIEEKHVGLAEEPLDPKVSLISGIAQRLTDTAGKTSRITQYLADGAVVSYSQYMHSDAGDKKTRTILFGDAAKFVIEDILGAKGVVNDVDPPHRGR